MTDSTWRTRTRWFAAEFLVVVSGILVALALQTRYQARQDGAAVDIYLSQLETDLATNDSVLSDAIRFDSAGLSMNASLMAAMYRQVILERDSALVWFSNKPNFYSDPRLVMGTVATLIGTGDIRLIRDPTLRSKVVEFAGAMESDVQAMNRSVERLVRTNDEIRVYRERNGVPSVIPGAPADSAHVFDEAIKKWPQLRADPAMRAAIGQRKAAFGDLTYYMGRMREATRKLSELVRAERAS